MRRGKGGKKDENRGNCRKIYRYDLEIRSTDHNLTSEERHVSFLLKSPRVLTRIAYPIWINNACGYAKNTTDMLVFDRVFTPLNASIRVCIYIYIYGKCLGFARTRNDDRRRIIIIIIIRIKPLLKIFNECRSLTGVGPGCLIEDLQWM